jgi:hypothetical protein
MSAIRGMIQDGKVVLDAPAALPDGTLVTVSVAGTEEYVGIGLREEDWPTTPEGIAALVAKMDQIQPFLTPEEEEAWHKARAEQKAWELANWGAHCKKIEDLFK